MPEQNEVVDNATSAIRDALKALEAEEGRLSTELATVKGKRKDLAKALDSLTSTTTRRRRGRPRKADTPAEAVAA